MNVRRRLCRVSATVVLTALAAPMVGVLAPQPAAVSAEPAPLRVVGELPDPTGIPKHPQRPSSVVGVDADRRRLFVRYTDSELQARVATYDMTPRIPRQVGNGVLGAEGDFNLSTRYTVAYDSRRARLAFISTSFDADGHSVPTGTATIAVYEDAARKVVTKWNVAQLLPGYYPLGITYSATDDRYYLVGEFSGQRNVADGTAVGGAKAYGPGTAVVAMNPDSGAVQWVRQTPECQQVLYSKDIGSLVVRSSRRGALIFACVTGGTSAAQTYPGQSGLVRLTVDPHADHKRAAELPLEFYAISGSYFAGGQKSGIAAYDGSTDRFYLQSIAFTTPGAFVFDGQLSAWVGFVSSPKSTNLFAGINEGLGHLYMGLRSGSGRTPEDGVIVADVRQTPVPAGEFTNRIATSSLIATDPKTTRLFVRPFNPNEPILVVEDLTPETHGSADPDYDAGTSNLPDDPKHEIFFSVGATGYGAQVVQVGGAGAPFTAGGPSGPKMTAVAPGTRALMTARVGAVDLRSGSAAAGAQTALVDLNTTKEYETTDTDNDGKAETWPYPVGSCLDAGGRPVKTAWQDASGRTSATHALECDATRRVSTATVRMGVSGGGGVTVKRSAFGVLATRNTTEGALVTTHSYADGTAFEVAGGYVVRLGHVSATTKALAHGTPGSAYSVWSRDVDGVRVTDPAGKVVVNAPGCMSKVESRAGQATTSDTCAAVAAVVNKVVPTRFRMEFPVPDVTTTPKGAFAGVEQTKGQYFQQLVVNDQGVVYRGDSVGIRPAPAVVAESYNDTTERSRTVTVLASTQSNAVFQVNRRRETGGGGPGPSGPTGGPGPGPGPTTAPGGGTTVPPLTGDGDEKAAPDTGTVPPQAAPPATPGSPLATLRGFLFMRRSAKDVALLVLLAGLLLGGAGTTWRRRRLVDVLVTVPGKEAL